jgi:Helix-turn-helix of DDE superfamily endonuclease
MELSLADRVLLVAVYYRTNLTYRQVALLLGISKSAAGRVTDYLAPMLATDTVLIADGALVSIHHRRMPASSKNHRYSMSCATGRGETVCPGCRVAQERRAQIVS